MAVHCGARRGAYGINPLRACHRPLRARASGRALVTVSFLTLAFAQLWHVFNFAFGWIGVIGDYKVNTHDFQVGLVFVSCEFLKLHWCASPVCRLAIWPRRPAWGAWIAAEAEMRQGP